MACRYPRTVAIYLAVADTSISNNRETGRVDVFEWGSSSPDELVKSGNDYSRDPASFRFNGP